MIDNTSLNPAMNDFCMYKATGEFALELKRQGGEVTAFGQIVPSKNSVNSFQLIANGLNVVGVRRRKSKLLSYLLIYLRAIPEIVKTDFVYIFYPSAFKYVAVLCWLLRTPYGVYIRGEQGVQSKSSQWVYKKALVIFTVTDYFTQMVNKIIRKNSAHSIRPMISLTEKDLVTDRKYKAKEHYTILFLARIDAAKGVKELLHAIKLLKEKNYSFTLNLVGDGAYLPLASEIVNQLEISDVVSIKGGVWDPSIIKNYYLDADLYILPTYHEGFPRTLYEAMIFGCPIITTFVGGISGVMVDKFNCIKIEPKSVDSIVAGLELAIKNYEQMATYAENGIATVSKIVDSNRAAHAEHLYTILKEEVESAE